jgi:predicted membrane-bound mannosyltransferase
MRGVNGTPVELDRDPTDAGLTGSFDARRVISQPWAMVAIMTLLAGVIRLWRIEFQSFWLDEAHTAFYIQGQTPEVIWAHLIKPGENGPVYYALLVPWARLFGGSELSLRGFSLVVSLPSVPLAFAVLRRLVPVRTALLGAGMVAFAPYLTWYAQEAKMYALVLTAARRGRLALCLPWLVRAAEPHPVQRQQHRRRP